MTTKRAIIRNTVMNSKIVAIVISILILLLSFHVNAQHNADSTYYAKRAKRALDTKKVGAVIMLLGTVAFIAGASNPFDDTNAAIGVAGMAAVVAGIPICIVGAVNHQKFKRKAQALTVRISATPRQSGLTLTYRF